MQSIKKILSDIREMKARENRFLVKPTNKIKNNKLDEKSKKDIERG